MKVYDREKGIEAVVALQKMVGIEEPRDRAAKNWDEFSALEKESTMDAYDAFIVPLTKFD